MQYDFAIDPVTKKKIVVFRRGFPKNEFVLAKLPPSSGITWEYYQGNNTWLKYGYKTAIVFNTQEEAELACTQHLNFLKECGYAI